MTARKFLVEGRVQGVFFRDSARKQAVALGLSGHALNLDNGSVEVVAEGEPAAIAALQEWLRKGPPLAKVRRITAEDIDAAGVAGGFRVG